MGPRSFAKRVLRASRGSGRKSCPFASMTIIGDCLPCRDLSRLRLEPGGAMVRSPTVRRRCSSHVAPLLRNPAFRSGHNPASP